MAQSSGTNASGKRGSVVQRFNRVLIGLYLAAIVIAAPTIYWVTTQQVRFQAERELTTLVDMVKSIQAYVAKDLRPFFLEQGLFHSPGFSGIVATSLIAENFKEEQPDYYIKNVSDNPLNPANSPKPLESELLGKFRSDRLLKAMTQEGSISGKRLLISAAPKVSKPGCMRCHGKKEDAPQQIREQFPGDQGYNYENDQVVGVSLVGVPMANVQTLALQRTGIVLLVLTVLFGLILFSVNRLVKKGLLTPILEITQAAHAISHGKFDEQVEINRDDEIGELARSVELVRRSFAKLMQRMRKRKS